MALPGAIARLLLSEPGSVRFSGSVLELGRQKMLFSYSQLRRWTQSPRWEPRLQALRAKTQKTYAVSDDSINDVEFLQFLGFDRVLSCDASRYEQADFTWDLNLPAPLEFHGVFDAVLDGGTMEHIFSVPSVLSNIHRLLKIGGYAIHIAPASNLVDHGFYSFSPTFFSDYYSANNYRIARIYFFECFDWTSEWSLYDYSAGCLDDRWGKIANTKKAGVFCIVQKTAASTCNVVPTQSYYSRLWQNARATTQPSAYAKLKRAFFRNAPGCAEFLYWARSFAWRMPPYRRRSLPPLAGKF